MNTFVVTLLAKIDALLHNFVYDGYNALSGYLSVPLGVIAAIYIAIFGYAIMMGWVRVNIGNFVKAVLKIGFIYMAVTQWAWVSENVVGLVNGAIGGMGDALVAASPIHIPGAGGIDGALQETMIQFDKAGYLMFKGGGMLNPGRWLDGIIIWGFGYILIAVALFEIILAKVMLSVLFVFTPLIVIFCYFKPFQAIFDKWLGAIVGFALLQLFVTSVLALGAVHK